MKAKVLKRLREIPDKEIIPKVIIAAKAGGNIIALAFFHEKLMIKIM